MSGPAALPTLVRSRPLIAAVAGLFTLLTLFAPALTGVAVSPARAAAASEEIEEKHSPIASAHADRRCKSRDGVRHATHFAPPPEQLSGRRTPFAAPPSHRPIASGHLIPLRC
ncbi:MAG TPA: hypothetical protein VM597_24830 [Gemmataceae bacterium]|nr:hypothetical protein [Gemmataceae bacterium]